MVDVIVATYNGEKYLAEQLDSILGQTYKDIRIIVRDDGSTDQTMDILDRYQKQYPDKIVIVQDEVQCHSSRSNFMQALCYSNSEYVMFSDQDDYWLPEKIARTLSQMKKLEAESPKGTPLLVFCSYIPVDHDLKKISDQKSGRQEARYQLALSNLLVQNYVHGCLMMINRALAEIMGNYEERILMHDWWAALLAAGCGKIAHFDEELMLYRQHGNNVVGSVNVKSFRYRIEKLRDRKTKTSMDQYIKQAELLKSRNYQDFTADQRKTLDTFIALKNRNKIGRMIGIVKGRYLKSDIVRVIGQLVNI